MEEIIKNRPDVAILDISMPKLNGLEVVEEIKSRNLDTKFVILTMYKDEEYFYKAIDIEVNAYILKENAEDELLVSLNAVMKNQYYISPILSEYLIAKNRKKGSLGKANSLIESLTPTERQVLKLVAENRTSKQIAEKLFISPKTVENHRANISSKLCLKGRNQLIFFAWENKTIL